MVSGNGGNAVLGVRRASPCTALPLTIFDGKVIQVVGQIEDGNAVVVMGDEVFGAKALMTVCGNTGKKGVRLPIKAILK